MHYTLAILYFGYLFFAVSSASTGRFVVMRRYYVLASTILALLIIMTGWKEASLHVLLLGAMTLIGKSILIPFLMERLRVVGHIPRITMRIRPSLTRLLALLLVVGVALVIMNLPVATFHGTNPMFVVVAFSSIFIALLALLIAKSTYSQLFGVLMIENGFSLLIFTLGFELHLFIELGLLLTALLAWFLMHQLSTKLTSAFGEESIDNLNELSE